MRKITKNIDLSKECFEKCDKGTIMNPSIRALMSQIDPRSPTLDFQRTPLAVLLKNPELMEKYNSLNASAALDCSQISNVEAPVSCQLNLDTVLADLSIALVENEDVECESNLESSSEIALPLDSSDSNIQLDEHVNRVPGLLETNLDYIETDLDTVKRKKTLKCVSNLTSPTQNGLSLSHSEESSTNLEDMSPKSEDMSLKPEDMSPTSEEMSPKSEEISPKSEDSESPTNKLTLKIKNLSDKDPRSPSVGINRTPIVLLENKEDSLQRAEIHSKMQEIFDNNMKLQQKRIDNKLPDCSQDFLLIYEDNLENKISTPIKKSSNNKNEACRTPLACMMNTHQTKLRNSPVITHMIPKKSKIPVKVKAENCFMDEKLNTNIEKFTKKNLIDSIENTPPKARQARWDQDKSVLL